MSRTLVIYHYYEFDQVHRDNLLYFLQYGWDEENDYIFVIAGGTTIDIPIAPNVELFRRALADVGFKIFLCVTLLIYCSALQPKHGLIE